MSRVAETMTVSSELSENDTVMTVIIVTVKIMLGPRCSSLKTRDDCLVEISSQQFSFFSFLLSSFFPAI